MRRSVLLTVFAASAAFLGACTEANTTQNKPVASPSPAVTSSPAATGSPAATSSPAASPTGSPNASPAGKPGTIPSPGTKASPASPVRTPEKEKGDTKGMDKKTGVSPTPEKK